MTDKDLSFGKSYRLCSKKIIDDLFLNGETCKVYPLIARYELMDLKTDKKLQVALTVPKKNHKNAAVRNRIKRQLRECVRHHKNIMEDALFDKQLALFIIYSSKEELPLSAISSKTEKLFHKIISNIDQNQLSNEK